MGVVRAFWRILNSEQRLWILTAQTISLLMAFSTVAGIVAISPFFAVLGDPGSIDHNATLHWLFEHFGFVDRHRFVTALGIGFVGIVILTNLINLLGAYAMLRIAQRIGDELRVMLFGAYLQRNFLFHASTNSTILFNNVAYETERSAVAALQSSFVLVTSLITTALIVLSILYVNPMAALAVVAALIGGYIFVYLTLRHRILRAGQIERQLIAERMKLIVEALGAIKEIIVLRKQSFFESRFKRSSLRLSRLAAYIDGITHSPKYVMECIAVTGLVAAALLLNSAADGVGSWLAQLTFLGFAVYRLLPSLQQAFAGIVKIRAAKPGFTAIAADLTQAQAARTARAARIDLPAQRDAWRSGPMWEIRCSSVCFRYGPALPPVLHDISLRIQPGTITGFVGTNGSGKTTLVDILSGLLVPDSGLVQIDGQALDEDTRLAWQSRIAYVPQTIYLLDSSIAENIALGIALEDIDSARMMAAARLAQLDGFIATLANGYRHAIGERGVCLSGGQRQRLGIARALYADASVLIMDEATSSLDVFAEADLVATIEALRGSRTIILIAHRVGTLRICDRIFELDQGTIVREGSWSDFAPRLMAG